MCINEKFYPLKRKHCDIRMGTNTNKYIDRGEFFIFVAFKFFNAGIYDIHKLRDSVGIKLFGTEKRYKVKKIDKSNKGVWLYVEDPKQLIDF